MKIEEIINIYCKNQSGKDINELFHKLIQIKFDPEIHYPLICYHIHFVMLEKAEQLMNMCDNKNDETYLCLNDFYQAVMEANNFYGIFPLIVPYRNWWNGPHLSFPKQWNNSKITQWNPGRISNIESGIAYCVIAKLIDGKIVYGNVELPINRFPYEKENAIFEIAFYENDYIIMFHEDKLWTRPPKLEALYQIINPILQTTHQKVKEFAESFVKNN